MFIPGMLPIGFCFAEFFCARDLFSRDAVLRRCTEDDIFIPGIFIPGIFIPGMLPMSCVFGVRRFRVATLFFVTAVFRLAFGLGFDIFIPGMLCMSCALTVAVDVGIRAMIINVLNPNRRMKTPTFSFFMVLPF